MKRLLPILVTMTIAVGLFVIDPVRHAEPAIDPSRLAVEDMPATIGPWLREGAPDVLPRAYAPRNEVWESVTSYRPRTYEGPGSAYVRIVIAQDRRDLLAYEPAHAMRAGGWSSIDGELHDGLWQTQHTRREGLLSERVILCTAYVAPGGWGASAHVLDETRPAGSGWPGPAALVQVLTTAPVAADPTALHAFAQDLATALSARLAGGERP